MKHKVLFVIFVQINHSVDSSNITKMNPPQLLTSIRTWLILFIIGLALSGITAFPIETELAWLISHTSALPQAAGGWVNNVYNAVKATNHSYPWLAYGTDWLAFAHLVIAIAFLGPLKDPVRNIWVLQFGMIACVLIFPLAFIAGGIRHIPFYWQLIDCSFGVLGLIPLPICYHYARRLEKLQKTVHGK